MPRMHYHSRFLINYNQIIIFVKYIKRNIFGNMLSLISQT